MSFIRPLVLIRPTNLVILLLCFGIPVQTSAQGSLPVEVRADILMQEITDAVKTGRNAEALERIGAYRALEREGHKTRPPVLLFEAKVASERGEHERAFKAVEDYLAVADRSEAGYQEAVRLYSGLKQRADAARVQRVEKLMATPGPLRDLVQNMVDIPGANFRIGKFEVTFDQYDAFAQETGRELPGDRGWGRGSRPVINVSWHDAQAYIEWLNRKTGLKFRLPSEAEWEYACRGGASETYCGGNDAGSVAWYLDNSGGRAHPVGGKQANRYGLHDMSGNVWEWTQDCWNESFQNTPNRSARTTGDCSKRVVRGGSWDSSDFWLRASYRLRLDTGARLDVRGFRLAQDP